MLSLMLCFAGLFCVVHARRQKGIEAEVIGLVAYSLGVLFFVMAFIFGVIK